MITLIATFIICLVICLGSFVIIMMNFDWSIGPGMFGEHGNKVYQNGRRAIYSWENYRYNEYSDYNFNEWKYL